MINVYIISGFLGAGKTTFIQKILKEKSFEKVMLLENEFGEVGVDASFFDNSLAIKEINNGCICCSLKGDFSEALEEIEKLGISDLIIEPSGVGKLSEIIKVINEDVSFRIVSHLCVVDVKTCQKYAKNFKEYFSDQVKTADVVYLSHVDVADSEKIDKATKIVKQINEDAKIISEDISDMEINELMNLIVSDDICLECLDEDCECEHHHHHHHEHHHHHHHDDEDEVFKSMVIKTKYHFSIAELEKILSNIPEDIIRIKGYVLSDIKTIYFNYVLDEYHLFENDEKDEGLVVIIGSNIDKAYFKEVFHG